MKNFPLLIVSVFATLGVLETGKAAQAIVTVDDSDNHLVAPEEFTGVVSLQAFGEHGCTGSLLNSGRHILTAAHCVVDAIQLGVTEADVDVVFSLPEGMVTRGIRQFILPPWIDPNENSDNALALGDIAILELKQLAPDTAERYEIYRNNDEVGQIATVVGYGNLGTGAGGEIAGTAGQKLFGQNKFESLIDAFKPLFPGEFDADVPESQLVVDFDNGLAINDAFGTLLGINDLGLGNNEVMPADGDSGAPWFIGNSIAGIVSYEFGFPLIPMPPEIDDSVNASFGEFLSNARVSFAPHAQFVDEVLASPPPSVPESSSIINLLAFGALGAGKILRRLRQNP